MGLKGEKMQKLANLFGVVRNLVSRKLVYAIVAGALLVVRAKFPTVELPSADFITDAVLALIACHTVTDVASIASITVSEYLAARARIRD